jgi:ribosomal protein S27E
MPSIRDYASVIREVRLREQARRLGMTDEALADMMPTPSPPASVVPDLAISEMELCGCAECRQRLQAIRCTGSGLEATLVYDPAMGAVRSRVTRSGGRQTASIDPEPIRRPPKRRALRVRIVSRGAFRRMPRRTQLEYRYHRCPSCESTFYAFQRATGAAICQSCGETITFDRGVIQQ